MSQIKVNVTGVQATQAKFMALAALCPDVAKRRVAVTAVDVERDAKRLFRGRGEPVVAGEPPRVQTGRLRSSIHRESYGDGLTVDVVAATDYASHQEFGTEHMDPHPFMAPAFAMHESEFEEGLTEDLQVAIKREAS